METIRIILLGIGAAILYGVLHDQVTARVCVEYFTIGHPLLIPTTSPTLLALLWGVLATWWVGVILGIAVAASARGGPHPRLTALDLIRPTGVLLATMAAAALVFGVGGYVAARTGGIWLVEPLASVVPPDKHAAFLADGAAHLASYGSGFLGGAILCVYIWRIRRKLALGCAMAS